MTIHQVILCGGVGARMWPASTTDDPKQFSLEVEQKSLFEHTLQRLSKISHNVTCVASASQRDKLREALVREKIHGKLLLEPFQKNTAAAISVALADALHNSQDDDLMLICPSDHYIQSENEFIKSVLHAQDLAMQNRIVIFGVFPNSASSEYGYISRDPADREKFAVSKFFEKPSLEMARCLIENSALWNSGIILARVSALKDAFNEHACDILLNATSAYALGKKSALQDNVSEVLIDAKAFDDCRSISFDYAVAEKSKNMSVVELNAGWSDVGGWLAYSELSINDQFGNGIVGFGNFKDSKNSFCYSTEIPALIVGVENLIVSCTKNGVLVINKENIGMLKSVLTDLPMLKPIEHINKKTTRPWGWFESYGSGDGFNIKKIVVKERSSISLQSHSKRAEHWIVVEGVAEVWRGDSMTILSKNESIYIPIGEKHRLRNPTDELLVVVEVQTGSYFGEDDIQRFEDDFGRV